MKNGKVKIAVISSAVMLCTSIAVFGASLNTEIKAILSQEVKVRYGGAVQVMKDGSGNVVYPIMYNGTTYLPIRSVSNMLDIPVNWEASTKTVILGTEEKAPKSILKFDGKTGNVTSKVTDKGSLTVEGDLGAVTTFNDGISYRLWNSDWSADYNNAYKAQIGGTYSKLSFDAYAPLTDMKYRFYIYNIDTKETLAEIEVEGGQIKKVEDIDITGVKNLGFAVASAGDVDNQTKAYFFNPTVK